MAITYLASSFIETLQGIFYTVFSSVFVPILTDILNVFITYAYNIFWSYYSEWAMGLLVVVCSLIDFVENIFNVFAGITQVSYMNEDTYLLDAFFQMKEVSAAFAVITFMAVAICFIFTIIKTAQSIGDMALEDKNPISKVLGDGMKAAVTFMLIPFLCIAMLQISSIITNQAVSAFNAAQGGQTTVGTIVFLASGMDADTKTTKRKNPIQFGKADDGYSQEVRTASFDDSIRKDYLLGRKDFRDLKQVRRDFHPANMNYLVGFAGGALLLFVMTGSVMVFIRRIFELLLLYIVSPFFVSTIPLDDGAMFAKWREAFIAKFFSGFGTVFAMRYYLMLVQTIASSNLMLYDVTLANGSVINSVLKVVMIIGGAWAVYKGQHLMMQILSPQIAAADQEAASLIKGIVIGSVSTAAGIASGGATSAVQAAGMAASAASAMGGAVNSASNDNQAYRG